MREGALEELEPLRRLIAEHLGLQIEGLAADRLDEVVDARARGMGRARYLAQVQSAAGFANELPALARALTVAESFFMRAREQLDLFVNHVLPERLRAGRPVRVLSAGCATGEEPYSLAILLREQRPDAFEAVQLEAIDVSDESLARARAAVYHDWSLRDLTQLERARWFSRAPDGNALRSEFRLVRFERRNLVDPDPLFWTHGAFDVIFCRNVLMYLVHDATRAVLHRFEQSLKPGGYLFLSHAESVRGFGRMLEPVHEGGAICYRKRDAAHHPPRRRERMRVRAVHRPHAPERRPQAPRAPGREAQSIDVAGLVALVERGGIEEAEARCREWLGRKPLDAELRYVLALCRAASGAADEARNADRTASALDHSFAFPVLHTGLLARRVGDTAAARRAFAEALTLLSHETDRRIALFGGGFDRDGLIALCRTSLRSGHG